MDGLWATKSEGVWLISVELVSKISKLCDPDPPTSQRDGQTDGRHAISIPRYALVHRAVKKTSPFTTPVFMTATHTTDYASFKLLTFAGYL